MKALATLSVEQALSIKLYERGCQMLERCITFDETKYWDSMADAAEAWAKIHKSERVDQLARALKLHAYRRLGEISEDKTYQARKGPVGGPVAWLQSQGMKRDEAMAARVIAKIDPESFEKIAAQRKPPAPQSLRRTRLSPWSVFAHSAQMTVIEGALSQLTPQVAASLDGMKDPQKIAAKARYLAGWFTEFADAIETSQSDAGDEHG